MRRLALLGCAVLMVGCAEKAPEADTMAAAMLSPADVAGTWTVNAMGETSDSVLVTYDVMAADMTWTVTLPGRDPMTGQVQFSGDSAVMTMGPFESVLRPGVQVTTTAVSRLVDGKLVGYTVAHYAGGGADSVARLRTEGTRKQ